MRLGRKLPCAEICPSRLNYAARYTETPKHPQNQRNDYKVVWHMILSKIDTESIKVDRFIVQFTPVLALYDPFGVDVPLNLDNTHSHSKWIDSH